MHSFLMIPYTQNIHSDVTRCSAYSFPTHIAQLVAMCSTVHAPVKEGEKRELEHQCTHQTQLSEAKQVDDKDSKEFFSLQI